MYAKNINVAVDISRARKNKNWRTIEAILVIIYIRGWVAILHELPFARERNERAPKVSAYLGSRSGIPLKKSGSGYSCEQVALGVEALLVAEIQRFTIATGLNIDGVDDV